MKRIKSANGYTIYQAITARDAETYGCEIGSYNIYTSQDIRDYGLTNSYPEYDNIDTLTEALNICCASQYAIACALADELSDSTVQDMDLILEIEQRLDAGEAVNSIRDCYDRETGRLYASISEAIAHGYDPYEIDLSDIADDPCEDLADDDDLDGDLEDVFEEALSAGDRADRNLDYDHDETDLLCRAMRAAGLEYDGIDSHDGFLVFDDWNLCFRQSFESWPEVREWLEGVVFDDPDTSDAVERILHPERFTSPDPEEPKHLPYTTQEEMRCLKDGDVFYDWFGLEHVAAGDAHPSGDASYDGYIVYDTHGESYFESDFAGPGQPGSRLRETWHVDEYRLTESLRQELYAGTGSEDTIDEIEGCGIWGVAVYEVGYADIELNITHEDDNLFAEYFVCLKGDDGDWHSWGYIDRYSAIDWSSPDWEAMLRHEMEKELFRFIDEQGYDITTPFPETEDIFSYMTAKQPEITAFLKKEPAPAPEPEHRSHASYYVVCCDGEYITCTASHDPELRPEWKRNAFFRDIAERIAFSDCSYDTVEEIVWDGEPCHYTGWQPGMLMEFCSDLTGEIVYSGSFPEWDH